MTDEPTAMSRGAEPRSRPPRPVEQRSIVWMLLASLVMVQFGYPISEQSGGWAAIYLLSYLGVIVFAVRTVRAEPRRHWIFAVLSAAMVAGAGWFALDQDNEAALQAMLAGVGLLQLGLLVLVLDAIIRSPRGTGSIDLLILAVCGFLLLGGAFGAAAALVELGSPGSFSDPAATIVPLPWQNLLYGSLVTLSAIGFGDVTPVSSWARSLFALEGIVGLMFVTVVISRMVSVAGEEIADRE